MASSEKAYGEPQYLPFREEHPLHGRHPYDVSKSAVDLIAQTYAATYQLPVAIPSRFSNLYGGGDLNWNRLIPGTIRSVLRGQRPIIRSDGSFKRDYVYVEDAVRAYLMMAEKIAENRYLRARRSILDQAARRPPWKLWKQSFAFQKTRTLRRSFWMK